MVWIMPCLLYTSVSTMPVFRVEKNSNYTTMCNYHLRDQGLSLKGKGLLSMLLSLPDTWNYSVRGLSSSTPDGADGVLTALKELERLGYLERNQQRESNGRMGRAEYVIYEMPRKKPCSESPVSYTHLSPARSSRCVPPARGSYKRSPRHRPDDAPAQIGRAHV